MALTAQDMTNIKELLEDVFEQRVEPRFEQVNARFDRMQLQMDALRLNLDAVAADVHVLREDVSGMKGLVKDHSFELARLKHRPA